VSNVFLAVALTLTITVTVVLKITGHIDLNKVFGALYQRCITKRYNKKANDYNRLFTYFHSRAL
jgi:hypothetical protein